MKRTRWFYPQEGETPVQDGAYEVIVVSVACEEPPYCFKRFNPATGKWHIVAHSPASAMLAKRITVEPFAWRGLVGPEV